MTAPIASIEDVSYQYPGSRADALRHHSWSINPGEVALLVGRSGSGKSTLLRCLNGLVPHYSGGAFGGTVRVAELDTRTAGPRQLSAVTGFVFQDPESQMITDRVEDEVAFTLEQHGVDRSTMRRLVDEALALAGITHLAARRPAELSGGERQRVAIAAALAARPRLLVFDEPTSQLDPEGAASIVRAIGDVSHDTGIAIAIAEHRLDHLLGMASSMQVLNGTVLHGHPREVVPRMDPAPLPAVARLARLLGMPAIPPGLKEARSVAWPDLPASPAPVFSSTGGDLLTRLDRVNVVRARRPVLRDLSLEVREGEMIALLGRNGSGKTTLLRSIAGLQAAQHGRVETLGLDMSRSHPADLAGAAGYVPQHAAALFHRERLVDELTLPTGRAGGWRDPLATLERLGLRAHAERHPLDLSGGERERAALAIALHGGPRLLLLDEPTRGMDAWRKRDLVQLLGELRDEGTGIVMATHDVELAAACATRVVILDEGEVAADGLPGDVLPRHPAFRPQINALFGGSWLTVSQILAAIDGQRRRAPVTMATMR